jgi:Co/Zn/Cd efflux system component
MTSYIAYEGVRRLISYFNKEPIVLIPKVMLITSIIGLGVNLIMIVAFHYDHFIDTDGHNHRHSHSHTHNHSHGHS